MLKSELQQLESLIGEIINYNETADSEIVLKALGDTLPRIKEACGQLRFKWVHELFSNVKETVIYRYIQFHQAGIISLSDHITFSFLNTTGDTLNNVLQVLNQLEGLLHFLQNSFYQYFDPEHAVSAYLCHKEMQKMAQLLSDTVSAMQTTGIEESLTGVLNRSVTEQIENARTSGISHRQIGYVKEILGQIHEQLKSGRLTTEELTEILYRLNFNSFYFERWYQNRVNQQVALAGPKMQAATIQSELAKFQDLYIGLSRSFDQERPSLDVSFTGWLLLRLGNEQIAPDKSRQAAAPTRMPLHFSVTQLALFVRLCYLEGCFNLSNISSILRFFTSHFETKKQLHISAKSFGRAFYGADQATAAVVRDVLLRMVGTLDKNYFPKT